SPRLVIIAVWAAGLIGVLVLRVRTWRRIRQAMGQGTPVTHLAGLPSGITAHSLPCLLEPCVVGLARPRLLLPCGIERRLSADQLHAVIAHELCHVRRHDNVTAAIHMIVEALCWFHPAVWLIGARLIDERERACDEAVLEATRTP